MNDLVRANENGRIDPLDQLPPELVKPTGEFYAFFSDSLKGTTGIAFRLMWWMRPKSDGGEGLSVAEAITAMRRMMRPEKCGMATYAGQVQAALAAEIEEILKRRRAKENLEAIKGVDRQVDRRIMEQLAQIGQGGT